MKLCLLLLLLAAVVAAQESPKPDSQSQTPEQKWQEREAKLMEAAEEHSKLLQAAIEKARQEVANEPDSAQSHFNLAQALYEGPQRWEDTEKIAQEYLKAIQLKPDYAEAYLGLGGAYYRQLNYKKAYECLNNAIRLKPDYADAYFLLGAFYIDDDKRADGHKIPVSKEDAQRGVEALQKAIKIKPDLGEAYFELGMAYSHLDKAKEAAEAFKQAILFTPNDVRSRLALGVVYVELGDKEAALEQYRVLKELADGVERQVQEGNADKLASSMFASLAERLLKKIEERFGTKSDN